MGLQNLFQETIKKYNEKNLINTLKGNLTDPHNIVMDIGHNECPRGIIAYEVMWCVDPLYVNTDKYGGILEIFRSGINYIKGNWEDAIDILMLEEVDTVFLFDVLGKYKKQDAKDLLELTTTLAENQVVVVIQVGEWDYKDFLIGGWQIWTFGERLLAIYTAQKGTGSV